MDPTLVGYISAPYNFTPYTSDHTSLRSNAPGCSPMVDVPNLVIPDPTLAMGQPDLGLGKFNKHLSSLGFTPPSGPFF